VFRKYILPKRNDDVRGNALVPPEQAASPCVQRSARVTRALEGAGAARKGRRLPLFGVEQDEERLARSQASRDERPVDGSRIINEPRLTSRAMSRLVLPQAVMIISRRLREGEMSSTL
jgi:hypothetical protein